MNHEPWSVIDYVALSLIKCSFNINDGDDEVLLIVSMTEECDNVFVYAMLIMWSVVQYVFAFLIYVYCVWYQFAVAWETPLV